MLLDILSEQNVVVNFLYRILVLSLTTFELIDVLVVHLDLSVCHRLLPVGKSSEFLVPVDPILCSVQKLLCKFEPSDEHKQVIPEDPLPVPNASHSTSPLNHPMCCYRRCEPLLPTCRPNLFPVPTGEHREHRRLRRGQIWLYKLSSSQVT